MYSIVSWQAVLYVVSLRRQLRNERNGQLENNRVPCIGLLHQLSVELCLTALDGNAYQKLPLLETPGNAVHVSYKEDTHCRRTPVRHRR